MDANEPKHKMYARPGIAGFYALKIPYLVGEARRHGYALAIHGSMNRDLDLIAVPWTDDASDAQTLVDAIIKLVDGHIRNEPDSDPHDETRRNPAKKPHGRLAWSIHLSPKYNGGYIDLSVMPIKKQSD